MRSTLAGLVKKPHHCNRCRAEVKIVLVADTPMSVHWHLKMKLGRVQIVPTAICNAQAEQFSVEEMRLLSLQDFSHRHAAGCGAPT